MKLYLKINYNFYQTQITYFNIILDTKINNSNKFLSLARIKNICKFRVNLFMNNNNNIVPNIFGAFYTITNASFPQNKNGYWSIIVWTVSSMWGRNCSNWPISLNSIGSKVGHQQIAKFFESILLDLQFSATLKHQ